MSGKIPGVGRIRAVLNDLSTTKTELEKNILQRWKNPEGKTRPVFLIGNVRSGTSMIVFQLAKSWQVKLYNEDNPAAFDYWHIRDFSVIENLLRQSYAPVTLFKPILDTYRIWDIFAAFPASKAIFTFRHYTDVVNSTHKRFYTKDGMYVPSKRLPPRDTRDPISRWVAHDFSEFSAARPPEALLSFLKSRWHPDLNLNSNIALRWYFMNRLYFDLDLGRDERIKLVNYETLVADPPKEFANLCRFLEIEYEPIMIDGVFSSSIGKDTSPDMDPVIRADCDELWARLTQEVEKRQELAYE